MARCAADEFGVPDLVFSEMAFLKKKSDDSEPVARVAASNKKQRRDQARNNEEEISAFFTSVRPALANANKKCQATSGRQSRRIAKSHASSNRKRTRGRELGESSIVYGAAPTVEKQGNVPCLDPSRGLSQGDTSQISWSESHRTLSRTPGFVRITPTLDADHSDSIQSSHGTAESEHLRYPLSIAAQKKDHSATELLRVSSVKPTREDTAMSQLCPPPMSSLRGLNPSNGGEGGCVVDNGASSAATLSNLPIFPSIETQPDGMENASKESEAKLSSSNLLQSTAVQRQKTLPGAMPDTMEDAGGHTRSSSFGLVLQECIDAVNKQRCMEVPPGNDRRQAVRLHLGHEETWHDDSESNLAIQEDRNIRPSEPYAHVPRMHSFAGPSIYELQERHHDVTNEVDLDPYCFLQGLLGGGEEGGFDIESWEGLGMEEPVGYDAVYAPERADEWEIDRGNNVAITQVEQPPTAESHIDTSRFWRPNKLY